MYQEKKTVCQFSLKELNKQGRPIYRQEDFWADIKEITNDLERSECPLNVDLSNLKELYNKIFNNEKLFLFIYGKTFEVVENGYYISNKTVKNSLDSHSASVDSIKETTISIISIEENDVLISKRISDFYYNGMTSCIEAENFTVPIFDKIPVGYVGPYVLRINTDLEDFNKNLEILKSKFLKYEHIKLFELKNGKK